MDDAVEGRASCATVGHGLDLFDCSTVRRSISQNFERTMDDGKGERGRISKEDDSTGNTIYTYLCLLHASMQAHTLHSTLSSLEKDADYLLPKIACLNDISFDT